jgi:ribonuclease R
MLKIEMVKMLKKSPPSKKKDRLFESYLKLIHQYLSGRSYIPLSIEELITKLKIHHKHIILFKKAILKLIKEDKISKQAGRLAIKEENDLVASGILRMHPRGFGFLQPDDPLKFSQDIFIPKHLTKNAVDGDVCEVLVNSESASEKGPEGRVISILKRSRTHVAGTVLTTDKEHAQVYVPLFGIQKKVFTKPIDERPLKMGDRLIMKVLDWGSESRATYCEMSHYLGHIDDPSCDVKASIEEFELRSDFPFQVIQEAKNLGSKVSLKEIEKRVDLRHMECFTIDPDTAKDFDDALSLEVDQENNYLLYVHIADVSFYVPEGSELDLEAKRRCNSTYFPGFCLPMLPHELSSELCSLQAKKNRLTLTVFIKLSPNGDLIDQKIFRSCIRSNKRFTYKEALAVLEGKKKSKHAPTLIKMKELCLKLKEKRKERGSLEFSLSECVIKVNEKGAPLGFETIEYDITHQLVEEFMLKANEVVATYLTKKGEALTYRVHDAPAEDSMKEFAQLAMAFGFNISKNPSPQELQKLFEQASSTPFASHLAASFIRSMKLAYYSETNEGHYGLSLEYYCHFTSPIRRYVDLVVHRIVCGKTHETETLSSTCHACSEQERLSAKAEMATVLLKKLRLLKQYYEENPLRQYEACITRVKNMGIIFEISDLKLESFLHVSELENDYFVYDDKTISLIGSHTGLHYRCGTKILVCLQNLNFITLESKWELYLPSKLHKKNQTRKIKK